MDYILRAYPITVNSVIDVKTGTLFGQFMSFAAPGEDVNKSLIFLCLEPVIPQAQGLSPEAEEEEDEEEKKP